MRTIDLAPVVPSRGRHASLIMAGLFLGTGALAATLPVVHNVGLYGLVFGLLIGASVPAYLQWQRGTLDWFEPLHVLAAISFIYFGLGAIWTVGDPSRVAYDRYILPYVPRATALCLVGHLCLLAGYYGPWAGRRVRREAEEYPRGMLFLLAPAALGFGGYLSQHMVYRATKLGFSIAGLISSFSQLAPLFVFAWALGWLMLLSGHSTRGQRWLLLAGMVPGAVIVALYSLNRKATVIALAAIPLMALWYAKRRIPWLTLTVLALLVVFVVFPFNNTFRNLDQRIPTLERLNLTAEIIGRWDAGHYLDRSLGTFKARMALINSVAVVVRDVPRWVPYAEGRTIFLPALIYFVPRVLWPEKPALTFGREFGETFRVVHVLDSETNMAATIQGELYWNFSLPGVLLGMALWGLVLRLYYRHYGECAQLDPVRRAIHLVLLLQFVNSEAGIVGPLVSVVRTLLVLEAYRLLSRHFGLLLVRRAPEIGDPDALVRRP